MLGYVVQTIASECRSSLGMACRTGKTRSKFTPFSDFLSSMWFYEGIMRKPVLQRSSPGRWNSYITILRLPSQAKTAPHILRREYHPIFVFKGSFGPKCAFQPMLWTITIHRMAIFKESKRQTFAPLLFWLFRKVDFMCVEATAESMDMNGFHKVDTSRAKGSKSAVQSSMNERTDHTVSCAITYKSATERRVQRDGARGTRTLHKKTFSSIHLNSNQNAFPTCNSSLSKKRIPPQVSVRDRRMCGPD